MGLGRKRGTKRVKSKSLKVKNQKKRTRSRIVFSTHTERVILPNAKRKPKREEK